MLFTWLKISRSYMYLPSLQNCLLHMHIYLYHYYQFVCSIILSEVWSLSILTLPSSIILLPPHLSLPSCPSPFPHLSLPSPLPSLTSPFPHLSLPSPPPSLTSPFPHLSLPSPLPSPICPLISSIVYFSG